jgi:hypothetical protein
MAESRACMEGELRFVGGWRPELGDSDGGSSWCGLVVAQWVQVDGNGGRPMPSAEVCVVWTSLGPLPRWVLGPTTRWAPGTTRLGSHGT